MSKFWALCGKLARYSKEKILIKRRIPKGDMRKMTGIEIFIYKNVESFLQDLKFRPTQLKTLLDKFAAVGILQGYLDYVNRKQAKKALISLVPNTSLQLI